MWRIFPFLFCWIALHPAFAADALKPSGDAMKQALHAVVRGQLEAFRRGDFAAAYERAAPGIRDQFPLAAFSEMVKTGYPEIATNTGVVFGLAFDDGDHAVVIARVIGKDGASRRFRYSLNRFDKAWRISGVVLFEGDETAI